MEFDENDAEWFVVNLLICFLEAFEIALSQGPRWQVVGFPRNFLQYGVWAEVGFNSPWFLGGKPSKI